MLDLSHLLSSPDVNWWTGVVWIIVMFLSAVWTLILTAPIHIHCWDIPPNLMKKQTGMIWEWTHLQQMLIFRWAIPLNLNLWRLQLYIWAQLTPKSLWIPDERPLSVCSVCARIKSSKCCGLPLIWDQIHLLRAVLRELLWTSQMSNHCCSTSLRGISLRSLPLTILQNHEPFSRNTVLWVYEKYAASRLLTGWFPGITAGNTSVICWGEEAAKRFMRTSNLNTCELILCNYYHLNRSPLDTGTIWCVMLSFILHVNCRILAAVTCEPLKK